MTTAEHDLVVIGAGPGGYVAAIRGAQLGLKVACVEREAALGGTCLRVGCIPSKALLHSSHLFAQARSEFASHGIQVSEVKLDLATLMDRKESAVRALTKGVESLFKKNKITAYQGHATLDGLHRVKITGSNPCLLTAKHVIIATGSKAATLPGVEMDHDVIGTSTEALSYATVPAHLVVIGAGAIGLELGSVWRRLGATVTVLEYFDRILPGMDEEVAAEAKKLLEKQGLQFRLGCKVTGARVNGGKCAVETQGHPPLDCDRVLVAAGRRPNTDKLGLETVGIELQKNGTIPVNGHFATRAEGIYAIGDVIAGPMLAHKAEEEGVACVEHLVTGRSHVNYDTIPGVVYTEPEVAGVGKTEEQLRAAGTNYKKGVFPFRANGRARSVGHVDGMVKLLADRVTDRILGVHIVGAHAGELINEAAVAISFAASAEDLARTCHVHPTLGEAVREAALAVGSGAIHA